MVKNRIGSNVCFIAIFMIASVVNAFGGNGYILPDYHRLLINGKAFTMNLGIYPDGTLFLKFNAAEYAIHDPEAFKRGTAQAMEDTQALQHGGENGGEGLRAKEPILLLYNSASEQHDQVKMKYFTLAFDRQGTVNQYPIKITFYNGIFQPTSYDFPPGELQYLQKKIDIILENKEEYIAKAMADNDGSQ